MPVDGELEDEFSLRYQMASIDDVSAALDGAAGIKIMILDACRNNPVADIFSASWPAADPARSLRRAGSRGWIARKVSWWPMRHQRTPVAMDGGVRNSPYTQALLRRLQEPGLEVEIMFRRIAADVNAQTGGRQRPRDHTSR